MTSAALAGPPIGRAEPRDYLSWSQISTYRSCPLKYYFKYVAGLPERQVSASLVFGAAIHRAIQEHFERLLAGDSPPNSEELLDAYHAEWRDRPEAAELDRSTLDPLAARMLDLFQSHAAARPCGRILAVEETLQAPLMDDAPEFLGRLDLVTETADALVVTDWKTSRSRWSAEQAEDASEQLLLYAELVSGLAPRKPVQLEFVVLTKTKSPTLERFSFLAERRRIERAKRTVERVWQAIAAEHFYPSPSPQHCGGCAFQAACKRWPG